MTTHDKPRIATVELGSNAQAQGDLIEAGADGRATVATGPTRRATGTLVPSVRSSTPS